MQGEGAKYLVVNRHSKAHWSETESTCISVDKSKLLEWMEYLIDNIYIKVGNRVYKLLASLWEQIVRHSWPICSSFILNTLTCRD